MAEDRDDLGHLASGARAAPAAAKRHTTHADGPDPARPASPARVPTADALPNPAISPPLALTADAFPDPSTGPIAVLYQRADHGLAVRWRLDPAVLAGARAAFAAEATPQLVMQITRVGSGDGPTRVPLDLGQRTDPVPADGDTRFPTPAGHGAIEAEIGFQDERGGWMLVARSNRLDAIGPVGVPFLRGDHGGGQWPVRTDAPAAPVGAGWAATIAADAAARTGNVPGDGPGVTPAPGPAPGPASNTANAAAPTPAAANTDKGADKRAGNGTDASRPVALAPRLPGPFPLWRQGTTPSPAFGNAGSARSSPTNGQPGRSIGGMTGGLADRSADHPPDWPVVEASPTAAPTAAPAPTRATTTGGGAPSGPTAATAIQSRLPTRGLELPPAIAPAPNGAEAPFRPGPAGADAGSDLAARSPRAGSGPVVRPGSSGEASLRAELVIYGSAAPGSLVDLGDHSYRVGPGGRFMLRLPLADRALILQVLAQLPTLPVCDRDAAVPLDEAAG